MPTFTTYREASKDEMGREIDRCQKVIAELEARLARVPDREAVARGLRAQYMGDPSDTWEDAEDEDRSIYLEMADFCLAAIAAIQETKP